MLGERPFRWIDDRCWEPRRRLDDMDAEGVGRQVISPIPVTFSYTLPAEGAAELARFQNEWIAGITREDPDRFSGLGTVPLQEPDVAAEMVVEIVTDLQLPGIEIGSNVGGRPTETAVAAAALVLGGVLDRHPTLRIVLAHGGGAFLALLTRIDRCTAMLPGITPPEHAPSEYARRFWYDTLVYDPGHPGPDGAAGRLRSDDDRHRLPLPDRRASGRQGLAAAGLARADTHAVSSGTAAALLKLPAPVG
ncbi:MAG: amidohydrolase [Actinomycetota bacterium]|nr:amidohydrolase [Actinomycetota bacterium]